MSAKQESLEELRRRRGNEIYGAIRKVLFWHWDPIGVRELINVEDEYDSYVGPVYRLLATGASDHDIEAYLLRTESETIGLGVPSGRDHLRDVVRLLREIDITGE